MFESSSLWKIASRSAMCLSMVFECAHRSSTKLEAASSRPWSVISMALVNTEVAVLDPWMERLNFIMHDPEGRVTKKVTPLDSGVIPI